MPLTWAVAVESSQRRGNAAEERREFGSGRRVGLEQNDDVEDATHRED